MKRFVSLLGLILLVACQSVTSPREETPPPSLSTQAISLDLDVVWTKVADSDGTPGVFISGDISTESAVFSPDGSLVASVAKGDDTTRLWRASDGQQLWAKTGTAETEAVDFTKDGQHVVVAGEDATIRVRRVSDGTQVRSLSDIASIEGLMFSPDGSRLATGNEAGQVKIWNTSAANPNSWPSTPIYTLIQGSDKDRPGGGSGNADINSVDWTSDGRFLVSAGRNQVVRLWDISNGSLVRTFSGFNGSSKTVRLSPNNTLVAAGAQQSPDGEVRVWERATGNLVRVLDFPNLRIVEAVEFSPDGKFLFVGGTEYQSVGTGTFYLYRVADLSGSGSVGPAKTLDVWNQEFFDFTDNGKKLVTSHEDGTLRLWDVFPAGIPTGETVSLRARVNNRYVSSENGQAPLIANRGQVGSWETFQVVDADSGLVALRANNGKYVSAREAGSGPLVASGNAVELWEKFSWVDLGDGEVALRAVVDNEYATVASSQDPLITDSNNINIQQRFMWSLE